VENQWLRRLVMHQNSQIMFSNKKQMVEDAKSCQPKPWKNM
jgi:hypothetical protein